MECSLYGTTFTKAVHSRFGVMHLCDSCEIPAQRDLRPAAPTCICNPDIDLPH